MNIECAGMITPQQLGVLKEAAMVPLKTQVFPEYEEQQKVFRVLRYQSIQDATPSTILAHRQQAEACRHSAQENSDKRNQLLQKAADVNQRADRLEDLKPRADLLKSTEEQTTAGAKHVLEHASRSSLSGVLLAFINRMFHQGGNPYMFINGEWVDTGEAGMTAEIFRGAQFRELSPIRLTETANGMTAETSEVCDWSCGLIDSFVRGSGFPGVFQAPSRFRGGLL